VVFLSARLGTCTSADVIEINIYDHGGRPCTWTVTGRCLPEESVKLLLADSLSGKSSLESLELEIEVILCQAASPPRHWVKIDPWRARDEFLRLPHDTKALRDFLAQNGTWSEDPDNWPYTDRDHPIIVDRELAVVFPRLVWDEQRAIRQALGGSAKSWFSTASRLREFELSLRPEFPHFIHVDQYCQDAIRNSITFDFLRGIKFGIRKRWDCAMPFEVAHKGKMYRSQYCGHLVPLRKKRAMDKPKKGRKR
jgi:hypothetical protein